MFYCKRRESRDERGIPMPAPIRSGRERTRSKPFVNALVSARGNAVETGRSETDTPQRGAASLSWLYVNAHPRCGRPCGARVRGFTPRLI